ncbi:MAG TPA: DUF1003 domain-containing protein [Acidisarcina sp.]|nr:DUF1003 domain-containing protein [Acidisarcina sp.]
MAEKTRRRGYVQGTVRTNIHSVAEVERSFEDRRSFVQYLSDAIADFTGTMVFVVLHVVFFAAWFVVNTHKFPGIPLFDPYPFTLLNMLVSVEAVLLSTFVLMKQNRMQRKTDHRDRLNLQIDLLAETEVTKMLQLLRLVCIKLDIQEAVQDEELDEMTRATSVDHVAQQIREAMPPSD